jgi:hypothetical protein
MRFNVYWHMLKDLIINDIIIKLDLCQFLVIAYFIFIIHSPICVHNLDWPC